MYNGGRSIKNTLYYRGVVAARKYVDDTDDITFRLEGRSNFGKGFNAEMQWILDERYPDYPAVDFH